MQSREDRPHPVPLSINPEEHRTSNPEHPMAAQILARFGVRSSMLDVRCFPSVMGRGKRQFPLNSHGLGEPAGDDTSNHSHHTKYNRDKPFPCLSVDFLFQVRESPFRSVVLWLAQGDITRVVQSKRSIHGRVFDTLCHLVPRRRRPIRRWVKSTGNPDAERVACVRLPNTR